MCVELRRRRSSAVPFTRSRNFAFFVIIARIVPLTTPGGLPIVSEPMTKQQFVRKRVLEMHL